MRPDLVWRPFAAWVICVLFVATVPDASAKPKGDLDADASCERHDLSVHLFEGEDETHRLVGWLCARDVYDGQTVVIATTTGFSAHWYWDFPLDGERYSYVRHAAKDGYAAFTYDTIGTAESHRPDAALVTIPTMAYVLHTLVGDLRAGRIGGVAFGKVVLVGNSLGSEISTFEAARYQDVDGLINTGMFATLNPGALRDILESGHHAQDDPKFKNRTDVPPGYVTTKPGTRNLTFYLPAVDPDVLALEEELKDTTSSGELATFFDWMAVNRRISIPVLSVVGDHDVFFCATTCEPNGAEVQRERLLWPPQTCFTVHVMKDAGHVVQLHPKAAHTFRKLADDWIEQRVGRDADHPASAPCVA